MLIYNQNLGSILSHIQKHVGFNIWCTSINQGCVWVTHNHNHKHGFSHKTTISNLRF